MTLLTVQQHAEQFAVCWLPPDVPVPGWAAAPDRLHATIRSAAELSIICAMAVVPSDMRHTGPFTAFEVEGPLDLASTGVLAAVLAPLAAAKVSVFTLSTFHTNWVLVPSFQGGAAGAALRRAGHKIVLPRNDSAQDDTRPGSQGGSEQIPGRTSS